MWLAIVYVCFTTNPIECGFVTTSLNTRSQCMQTLEQVSKLMDADDKVLMYDRQCIEIKMS